MKTEFHKQVFECLSCRMIAALVIACAISLVNFARADDDGTNDDASLGRHRLDLTVLTVATFDTNVNVDVALLGYTRAFNSNTRVTVQTGMIYVTDRPDPGASGEKTTEAGWSDTVIALQYDFSEKMLASPWIPKTLGLNAQLILPTGDADDGTGSDAWYLNVGVGWAVDLFRELDVIPSIGYETTFREGDLAVPASRIYAAIPIIWVTQNGFWIGYAPTISRDLESDEWLDDHGITIGKMFRNGFGLSLDYGVVDRVGPVSVPDDAQLVFNFYYQFGN